MAVAVVMPQMGETVVEGTVSRWLKAPGDAVTKLEPLLEIATDKIDTEVPAPADGLLLRVVVLDGETVAAGTVLAYIGAEGEALPADDAPDGADADQAAPSPPVAAAQPAAAQDDDTASSRGRAGRSFISPVVARMAAEHDLDLAQIDGTGLGGRITKKDVQAYIARREAAPPSVTRRRPPTVRRPPCRRRDPAPAHDHAAGHCPAHGAEQADQPHVTTVAEVDMTRSCVTVRRCAARWPPRADADLHGLFRGRGGGGLAGRPRHEQPLHRRGCGGEQAHPRGHGRGRGQRAAGARHPGRGRAQPGGLGPGNRRVDDRGARGTLGPDALHGGTFTITNHGTGGSLLATPIINQPQAGILGIGAIVKRPVVRSANPSLLPSADDAIVIRPMCYLSLSFDHRVLDGAQADAFLMTVKTTLEEWRDRV
ncbi:MAG: 2-oxo acid dehydrogenase subunit E2 [Caldilineaceae bacterium]